MQSGDEARRRQLAEFLRSRRDRLAPEAVGLPRIGRRRAPGLRREEVAQLAGVGVTWYTWLEQARPINVSTQVLRAIARALRLSADETAHLFVLSGMPEPALQPEHEVTAGSMAAILDALNPLPAHVVTARYDVVAWNRADSVLMGDYSRLPPNRRNILWLLFTEPAWQRMIGGFDDEVGSRCVARFRRNFAAHADDPSWQELVDELYDRSPEFRKLWDRHDVALSHPKVKTFAHPHLGAARVTASTLWLADEPGSRIVIYTPIDSDGEHLLSKLADSAPWCPWTTTTQEPR